MLFYITINVLVKNLKRFYGFKFFIKLIIRQKCWNFKVKLQKYSFLYIYIRFPYKSTFNIPFKQYYFHKKMYPEDIFTLPTITEWTLQASQRSHDNSFTHTPARVECKNDYSIWSELKMYVYTCSKHFYVI